MCLTPIYVKGKYVACGNCIECQMLYSSTWAFRIGLEAQLYEHNCFITLTYNEDNRPKGDHLSKRDLQLFLKRLRKHFNNKKIRFFACGEYGDKKGRPHYHIILFNCNFEDMYFFSYDNKKNALYRSPTLEKLWIKGFSSICELNDLTAKYCAKYLQKIPIDGRPKPFVQMSRRPGIGFSAISKKWIDSDKMYLHGKSQRLPRYFIDVLSKENESVKDIIKQKRENNNAVNSFVDNTGTFRTDLFFNYLDRRAERLEKSFLKEEIKDTTGKKAIIKERIKNSRERNKKRYLNDIRFFANQLEFGQYKKNYKLFYDKLLTKHNPLNIIDNDISMRKSD